MSSAAPNNEGAFRVLRITAPEGGILNARHPEPARAALFLPALVGTHCKPKKIALTACIRKLLTILNAIMRTNTAWRRLDHPDAT